MNNSINEASTWSIIDNKIVNELRQDMCKIQETLNSLESKVNELSDSIIKIQDEFKKTPNNTKNINQSINEIKDVLIKNHINYRENKKIYLDLLNQVCQNDKEMKPVLQEIKNKNTEINSKLLQPVLCSSRVYNRFWRSTFSKEGDYSSKGLLSLLVNPLEQNIQNLCYNKNAINDKEVNENDDEKEQDQILGDIKEIKDI